MSRLKLSISLVPQPLWRENLRRQLSRSEWDRLRIKHFSEYPNCQYCDSYPVGSARHAHEDWVYDAEVGIARLASLKTVCRMCHFTHHPGFVRQMVKEGKFAPQVLSDVVLHFCAVNGCSIEDYQRHCMEAKIVYDDLSA